MRKTEDTKEKRVETLAMGLFKIGFREMVTPSDKIPDEALMGDYGSTINSTLPWEPCWFINGWYSKINHGMANTFIIDPDGPHTVYITELPIDSTKDVDLPFITHGKYKLLYKEVWREQGSTSAKNNKYILQII